MRDFKKFTSTQIRIEIENSGNIDLLNQLKYEAREQKFKVWQDRSDDVYLEDRKILENKLEYMHDNPLQEHWSLVKHPEEYLYSSAAFYLLGKKDYLEITDYREHF